MELDPKKRQKFEKLKWAVHFPNKEGEEEVLKALKKKGFSPVRAERFWQNTTNEMYDIPFAAAEFIINAFPAGQHARILLRHENCRGWLVYAEGRSMRELSTRLINNDSLFGRPRRAAAVLR